MTIYHIEPVIVPPWTPENQNPEDDITRRYVRIAECGYRIQWVESEQPRIDYFKRDKPEDFYPVAGPSTVLEGIYGALIFQLAEQVQSLKGELAELKDVEADDRARAESIVEGLHVKIAIGREHRAELTTAIEAELSAVRYIEADAHGKTQNLLYKEQKEHGYWYRRACFAELALGVFERHRTPWREALRRAENTATPPNVDHDDPRYWRHERKALNDAFDALDRVLAESRKTGKPEIENLEDYVRQERQRKMHGWALRSFGPDRMGIYDRAVRLYEESVELFFAWIYDAVAEDLQIDHGPEAHAKWVEVAQNARDHAIRVLDAKMVEPPGKVEQEIGGVALTLNIGAQVSGHAVALCERQEFERVLSKPQTHWTAREAFKQDQGL